MESHEERGLSNLYQWETQRNASTHSKCKLSLILIFNLLPFEKSLLEQILLNISLCLIQNHIGGGSIGEDS